MHDKILRSFRFLGVGNLPVAARWRQFYRAIGGVSAPQQGFTHLMVRFESDQGRGQNRCAFQSFVTTFISAAPIESVLGNRENGVINRGFMIVVMLTFVALVITISAYWAALGSSR